jgi:hypothetical protein
VFGCLDSLDPPTQCTPTACASLPHSTVSPLPRPPSPSHFTHVHGGALSPGRFETESVHAAAESLCSTLYKHRNEYLAAMLSRVQKLEEENGILRARLEQQEHEGSARFDQVPACPSAPWWLWRVGLLVIPSAPRPAPHSAWFQNCELCVWCAIALTREPGRTSHTPPFPMCRQRWRVCNLPECGKQRSGESWTRIESLMRML